METEEFKITATELAQVLSDILNRVQYRGEAFVVVRNGEPVARIGPAEPAIRPTLAELEERFRSVNMPGDGFADDLEEIQVSQRPAEFPDWRD